MTDQVRNTVGWRAAFEVVTTLAMVSLAALLVWQNYSAANASRPVADRTIQVPTKPINISGNPTKGSEVAPIALIEYTDFECPYCATVANGSLRQLATEYVQTGKVLFIVKNLPLPMHLMAPRASVMALCAGEQGKFWEMHDALFTRNARLTEPDLQGLGSQIGLDRAVYQTCLDSDRPQTLITADKAEAAEFGIKSTPTFVFGRLQRDGQVKATDVLRGAQSIEELRAVLNRLLK